MLIRSPHPGSITALGSAGNAVIQINNNSANGATFTNSGTVRATLASGLNVAIGVYNGTLTTNTGGVTVNNTGTISGNVSLGNSPFNIASANFNNNAGGIWNVNGFNWFGGTAGCGQQCRNDQRFRRNQLRRDGRRNLHVRQFRYRESSREQLCRYRRRGVRRRDILDR